MEQAGQAPPAGEDDARLLAWRLVLPGEEDVSRAAEAMEAAGHQVTRESGRLVAADPWGTVLEVVSFAG